MRQSTVLCFVALVLALTTGLAQAGMVGIPVVTGQPIVASGGNVQVYFAGYEAAYTEDLFLVFGNKYLFTNKTSHPGDMVDLGDFAAGEVLTFSLYVHNTGLTYYTGPASLNPDNVIHAAYANWAPDLVIPVFGTHVGFEDLWKGGDFDYNDLRYVVKGAAPIPEPGTASMFALAGAALLATRRWTRRWSQRC